MKQIIAQNPVVETISITELVESEEYLDGIVVQVYENRVSFLADCATKLLPNDVGFRRIQFNGDAHSCSATVVEALNKSKDTKTYHFDSLQELAKAIVKNGWE